jgi:hypothetical protein
MKKAENGEMTIEEYVMYKQVAQNVFALTALASSPKYITSPDAAKLLQDGWIVIKTTKWRSAGWVTQVEHPEGMLSKPCEVCGYKYGTKWLLEEVPEDVLEWLHTVPGDDNEKNNRDIIIA